MTQQYEAPHVNGIVGGLTEVQTLSIQGKLRSILDAFIPSYEQPVADTFYLVVTYTGTHSAEVGYIQINGDTAEYCLNYVVPVVG